MAVMLPMTKLRLRMRAQHSAPTSLLYVESSSDAHSALPVCSAWAEEDMPG